jgi:hypothetical protein
MLRDKLSRVAPEATLAPIPRASGGQPAAGHENNLPIDGAARFPQGP